jgi:hypothetical protein
LEPERLEMFNLSSAEGARFAEIASEMCGRLAELGPSPLRMDHETTVEHLEGMSNGAEPAMTGEEA